MDNKELHYIMWEAIMNEGLTKEEYLEGAPDCPTNECYACEATPLTLDNELNCLKCPIHWFPQDEQEREEYRGDPKSYMPCCDKRSPYLSYAEVSDLVGERISDKEREMLSHYADKVLQLKWHDD